MSTLQILTNDIALSELTDLFCGNQQSFYRYIARHAASNDDDAKQNKPLRFHKINNAIDCIFSPNMKWSFYNAILDTDISTTIKDCNYENEEHTVEKILSFASKYKCPIRATVKPTAANTKNLLERYGFFQLPSRTDVFQYVDFNNNSYPLSYSIDTDITIYELDDLTQENCEKIKSEWGYVLCDSFGFQNPEIHGPFYSDVWKRVEVGPTKPIRMFVAMKNGRVVGGSQISLACGIACLFNVTTIKSERGKGIGNALSLIAIQSAKQLNYRYVVLQASNMGAPVYKKIGFKPIPFYSTYVKISTVKWYYQIFEILIRTMNMSNKSNESLFPKTYPEFVYNFAYGSNMTLKVLSGRRKIHPIESIPGVLEGWQLTFDLRGIPGVEPCFGNIKENPNAEIHGILHKMTNKDFKRLLETEGGGGVDPNGYIPTKVNVHAYDGRIIEAYALVASQSSPVILQNHTVPSARYMGLLRQGAQHFKIHPLYIEYLQSLPSHERSKPIMILVIIEILSLVTVTSVYWAPKVVYYLLTKQKPRARAFFFTFLMVNTWRIYRFFGGHVSIQPYYSAPFPLGSTNFKENSETFRCQVQIDETMLENSTNKQKKEN